MRMEQSSKIFDSRGMTLVELIVVMAILSIVMMAVMSLYVPVQQSTVSQTQVADVQSNLRLAANRMTKDLLIAGFLVADNPIIFQASATPTTAENPDDSDFTIRTRAVGNSFARVEKAEDASGDIELTVTDPEMVDLFPVGTKVRLFEPMTGEELLATIGTDSQRVYEVTNTDKAASTIDIDNGVVVTKDDILAETVVLKVKDSGEPPMQTIRYRLVDGHLTREVNGNVQFLARNMDSVQFLYDWTSEGRVRRVDILLTGATDDALKDGPKSRQVDTSVTLRNVY
jgi:prepilin-type N-terminal cleavage/methylation domain-containing protein